MEQRVQETRLRSRRLNVALLCLAVLIVLTTLSGRANYVQLASEALAKGDFPAACSFADQAWQAHPGDVRSILVGAEAAEQNGDLQRAVDFLMRLPATVQDSDVYSGRLKVADLQLRLGQLTLARTTYEAILDSAPDDPTACRRLATLFSGCGYHSDSLPLLRRLVAANEADSDDLVRLALNGTLLFGQQQLERAHELCPDDPMAIVGLMKHEKLNRNVAARRSLCVEALALEDISIPLKIQVLEFYLDTAADEEAGTEVVATELPRLLSSADTYPDTWRLLAQWSQQQRLPQLRLRCLIESVIHDRWNAASLHALSEGLRGDDLSGDDSAELARVLKTIQESARSIYARPEVTPEIEQLATSLQSIGRLAEVRAWARIALRAESSAEWASSLITSPANSAHVGAAELQRSAALEMYRELVAELPLPYDFLKREVPSVLPTRSAIRFEDASLSARIPFLYNNGVVPGQEGLRMHQWTGGGVGVIDIDADGWPDLYFSQGQVVVDDSGADGASGGLYRNLRGNVFDDVSRHVSVSATAFGQGVAIGDVNNDGFADLYVAGTGGNTLQLNQGDGTFQEVTGFHGSSGWTTSVAIADLNGDSHPDIYDVNYVGGPNAFQQTCDHEGRRRTCGPNDFPAESDRIFFSDGAGGYEDVSATSGFSTVAGRGMGVVVGDVLSRGTNQVFVANDEAQNFFFTRSPESAVFRDDGFVVGAAYDKHGAVQGTMGVAVGDVDGNHRPDLFVTNYYAESNTLYSQRHSTGFIDDTAAADLAAPGYSMLGFGCQFFDADADGDPDLIVANGHLDDFTHMGHPFRMRPHFYENIGSGRMAEAEFAGDYFETPVLGRSVATLDWNGDGRCDVVVTHLDSSVALLTNRTPQAGATSTFTLIGTRAARDAVGGSVGWASATGPAAWRMAGDGYQCSNEPVLRLSQNAPESNERGVTVSWPGRRFHSAGPVSIGKRYGVVEDRPSAYELPH